MERIIRKVYEKLEGLVETYKDLNEEDENMEPDLVFEIIHQTISARCAGRLAAAYAYTSSFPDFCKEWRELIRSKLL